MKRLWIIPLGIGVFALNSHAGMTFGIKGGYSYQNLKGTELTITMPDTSFTETIEDDTARGYSGFGGELSLGFDLAPIPLAIEANAGYYTTSHSEKEGDTTSTSTLNSIKISALGKYKITGMPIMTPWIGAGPFVALNTHKSKTEYPDTTYIENGEMVPNFGVLAGMGLDISLPGFPISFNVSALFDYFLVSKGKFEEKDNDITTTIEPKFNQWGVNAFAGITFKM